MEREPMAFKNRLTIIRQEVREAHNRFDLALYLAWSDTRTRYRRSVLGPLWLVFGTLIGVGGLGVVWSTLFHVDRAAFIPALSVGLVTWYLLNNCITESASVFYTNRDLILNIPLSSILVSMLLLFRQVINFLHNMLVVVVVLLIYPENISLVSLLSIPGFLLVCINLLAIIQIIGYLGARYRDLAPLLSAIMQPIFFISPVIFRPQQLGSVMFIANWNPFAYWLSLVRDPLLGSAPSLACWMVVLGMTVVGWTVALLLTAAKRQRLAYWVN